MIAYVDASVLLRLILGEPGRLAAWPEIRHGVTSALAEVEVLRTLDRLRLSRPIAMDELVARREAAFHLLDELDVIEVTRSVLARAAQPLPTPVGTLDAIHLASALLWREANEEEMHMATHDAALATAARACGMDVVGA